MISILVCSVRPNLYQQLKANIEQTVGVTYELLQYDNRGSNKGLCEVYNVLAAEAKYNLLCFVHEDVIFTTLNWGKKLVEILEKRKADVVGVAGSKYKSKMFSGWFTGISEFDCANIIHQLPDRNERIFLQPQKGKNLEEVVCLDGVFISCTRGVWENVKFGEELLKGFHFYDIDFSLRAAMTYTVVVSFEIDIVHITHGGDFGDKWVDTAFIYHKAHAGSLPFTKIKNLPSKVEPLIARNNLDALKTFPISFQKKLKWIRFQQLWFYPGLYYEVIKFLVYEPMRLKYIHNLFKRK